MAASFALAACKHDFERLWAQETASERLWGREDDGCHRCLNSSCADSSRECTNDSTCSSQVACLDGCAAASCAAQCVVDGEAQPIACWREACFDACWVERNWADATEQRLGGRFSAACGACFDRECREAAQACTSGTECIQELNCHDQCTDPPCMDRCLERTEGDAAMDCLRTECFEECKIGRRFDCLREYGDPRDTAAEVTLTAHFADLFSNAAGAGLSVEVCPLQAIDCSEPVLVSTTDAEGNVSLTIHPSQYPGAGLAAFLRVSGTNRPVMRYYSEFPLYADREVTLPTSSHAAIDSTHTLVGLTRMRERGGIIAIMRDCQGDRAPALRMSVVEADERTSVVYQRGRELSPGFAETDNTGLALIANVPPGPVTLRGYANDGKDLVIELKVGIEPAGLTCVSAVPIPSR
jgi:hypothetical protein